MSQKQRWPTVRLKNVCSESAVYGANIPAEAYTDTGIRFIRTTDITETGGLRENGVYVPHRLVEHYLLQDGDILLSRSGTIGRTFLYEAAKHGHCSYAGYLVKFKAGKLVRPRFVNYCAQSSTFKSMVQEAAISSTIENVNAAKYANFRIPLPAPDEQAAIVRFLDYADEQIQRYIAAKERLIALLEEQRQVVIHQAVTRGLEPNARLEDSGVEWLGDAPQHWQRQRLKTVLEPIDERSTTGSETLLSLRRDYGVVIYDEHFERPSQSRSLVGFKLVSSDQLVVNRLQANNGLVFNSNLNGLVSPDYSVFQEKLPLHMRFLSDLLRTSAYRAYFRRNATGLGTGTSGFLRLYDDVFLGTPVCLPPLGEQCAIVKHLDQVRTDIDSTVARTRRQIDLMNEYRTRLIADVVTGKLDVREAAANLPDPEN